MVRKVEPSCSKRQRMKHWIDQWQPAVIGFTTTTTTFFILPSSTWMGQGIGLLTAKIDGNHGISEALWALLHFHGDLFLFSHYYTVKKQTDLTYLHIHKKNTHIIFLLYSMPMCRLWCLYDYHRRVLEIPNNARYLSSTSMVVCVMCFGGLCLCVWAWVES